MFKITMMCSVGTIDMPKDKKLKLFEACYRCDIYKEKNPKATFTVVNEETGDIEYQV